jgi:kynurenine 3-monooxygenase
MVVRDVSGSKDMIIGFDFCIGADGSYSIIRRQLMRVVRLVFCVRVGTETSPHRRSVSSIRMDYHQEYIPHEYLELRMPAGRNEDGMPTFLLDPNYLHIWPRHSFMLIALPNKVAYAASP